MRRFQGNGCAPGVAEGIVLLKKDFAPVFSTEPVRDTEKELGVLEESLQVLSARIDDLYEQTLRDSGEDAAQLIESYQMILLDRSFFDSIRSAIRERSLPCITAIKEQCDGTEATFAAMDDPYMRDRFEDIRAVCDELIALCCGTQGNLCGLRLTEPTIVVADTLTPVDTLQLDKKYLRGFVTESGGVTSHSVILARTLGIPAVVGVSGIVDVATNGMNIQMSGDSGEVILEPDEHARTSFRESQRSAELKRQRYRQEPLGEAYTRDGQRIFLNVNSGDPESIEVLDPSICDGVGLFRTEFLYMNRSDYPSEEELFQEYRKAVEKMEGKEFIIRSLDIGGDKALAYMDLPEEENPFLGYRAVRISLDRPDLFRTQLRAILRSSAFGNVKLMFPMITSLQELRQCKAMVEHCKGELRREGIQFREDLPVGIMVETPASVFVLDQLAAEADFFSIGTNDLLQYLMAADRGNPHVHALYDPFQISFLRALQKIGEVAFAHKIPVGVCGEVASVAELVPFLIGCGVTELSVAPSSLTFLRWLIRRLDARVCQQLVYRVTSLVSADEARKILRDYEEQLDDGVPTMVG